MSLSAIEMSSAETAEELPPPFVNFAALVCDHSYLPTRFGGLIDNALVYIAGFVVRQVLKRLSCHVCRASLVADAVPSSHDESYHLLVLKNNGGLMIPSEGTVKVVRAAERVIRQVVHSEQAPKVSVVMHVVREEIGTDDVFLLGEHTEDTQFGIDNHHSDLLKLVVSVFLKIRLHHIAKLTSLEYQSGSTRKKLCKTVLFQGF